MKPQGLERRLTTILSADVVGYSRLMGSDEAGTLAALKTHRNELIDPKTAQYRGRTIKLMGDGALMEFGSVVDAVAFAVEVQCSMQARNAKVPEGRRITYRIGINIGDVIVEAGDLYGDGVNVVARLQDLAEPGGISIARNVFDQVKNKLDLTFECLGEKDVKNIAQPVTVYRVALDDKAAPLVTPIVAKPAIASRVRRPWIAAGILAGLLTISGLVWWERWAPEVTPAAVKPAADTLPTKPSIAVLPFDNMSGDPETDYFSDGISEDIITELSRFPDLLVIARNSSFTYKDNLVKAEQVAKELGVRYILEGSVRKSAGKVRITAQLIDATTGLHVWADRFDNEGTDVFTLQDQVTTKIIGSIAGERGQIRKADYKHAWGQNGVTLSEYDYFLRIHSLIYRFSKGDMARARAVAVEGLAHFPDSPLLKIKLGWCLFHEAHKRWSDNPSQDYQHAFTLATEGLSDQTLPPVGQWHGRWLLSSLYLWYKKDLDSALREAEATIALVPNDPETLVANSRTLLFAGKPDEALVWIEKAISRTPIVPPRFHAYLGWAYYLKGDYEQAHEQLEYIAWPDLEASRLRAVTLVELGRLKEARLALDGLKEVFPEVTVSALRDWLPYKKEADLERELADLRKAGLSE